MHSCPLLKITSEISKLLEVLRGASNIGVILRNYLEAPKAGNQLLINLFLFKNHKKMQSFSFLSLGEGTCGGPEISPVLSSGCPEPQKLVES